MQCARANGFKQGARVHELLCVNMDFCAVRAHESFVQCASAMSSRLCNVLIWDQYGSWAGACTNKVVCFVIVYGSVYRRAHAQESVPQYGVRPPGLCTMCICARAGTCVDELMCASLCICTVRVHQGFVLLCSSVRCEPKGLCAVRTHKGFIQCAGAHPPGLCTKCLCARAGT